MDSLWKKTNYLILSLLIILFTSLPAISRGDFSKAEIKKAWRDTGYSFEILFNELNTDYCHKSEKTFSGCLMAFHKLLSSMEQERPRQLRVSDSSQLEIVPFVKQDNGKPEDTLSEEERRESFRLFFHKTTDSTRPFDNIVRQIRELVKKIPKEDQSYFAGTTYDNYLKEVFDSNTHLLPKKLERKREEEYFEIYGGIGASAMAYKINGKFSLAMSPHKGSLAETMGLGKGDLILKIDGFDVSQIKNANDVVNRLNGLETQVTLEIHSFCHDEIREIKINREPVFKSSNWVENSYFVNLTEREPLDCDTEDKTQAANTHPTIPSTALYVSLESFFPSTSQDPGLPYPPLCLEFMKLQGKDLMNPSSLGMIIDLRGNKGGSLHEVSCMLNSLISSDDIIMTRLPVSAIESEFPEIHEQLKRTSYYFTKDGFLTARSQPFYFTYNKNIVVLVDDHSTSAAEVFAGTIQDMKRGWVIGDRTSGKGSFQTIITPFPIPGMADSHKPLQLNLTSGIYTLNSGRSPHGYGIIPDFRFSFLGEPIETNPDFNPPEINSFLSKVEFENIPWKQNRPKEIAQLETCIENNPQSVSKALRKKIQEDEKYRRPYISDYLLELAKDILACSPRQFPVLKHSRLSPVAFRKVEHTE